MLETIFNPYANCKTQIERHNMHHFLNSGALDMVIGKPEKIASIIKFNVFDYPLLVNATYCPTCRKPAKTYLEAEFITEIGECGTCDHVRGDIDEYPQLNGDCAEDFGYERDY